MTTEKRCPNCGNLVDPDSPNQLCVTCLLAAAKTPAPAATIQSSSARDGIAPPKPEEIDDLFPDLEILDLVGHGGMGAVYKARQKSLGRLVAVKIFQQKNDPAFAERFAREARAMAMLSHPNIIAIHDYGQRGPYHYLVMEYIDGLNLRQVVADRKLAPAEALSLIPQLCDALQYAHDQGIVHRDIKPENVLLGKSGNLKIADFGLAKMIDGKQTGFTLTQAEQVMGTWSYMAPEQMERPLEVDHRADIYSLGVVIYELLTGELPIGRFAPPSKKVEIDVRLDEVVLRALEREPEHRFQQVSEFKTGVQNVGATPPILQPGGTVAMGTAALGITRDAPPKPGGSYFSTSEPGTNFFRAAYFSVAMFFCMSAGMVFVLGSDEIHVIPEGISKLAGIGSAMLGGFLFAMMGVIPGLAKCRTHAAKAVYFGVALFVCMSAGMIFVMGSDSVGILPRRLSMLIGIGTAMFGGFLFAIMGPVMGMFKNSRPAAYSPDVSRSGARFDVYACYVAAMVFGFGGIMMFIMGSPAFDYMLPRFVSVIAGMSCFFVSSLFWMLSSFLRKQSY